MSEAVVRGWLAASAAVRGRLASPPRSSLSSSRWVATIHFVERFERQPAADPRSRVLTALREAGPAITADAAAIALGFGLLCLSQAPSNARLGLLVAVALAASWLPGAQSVPAAAQRDFGMKFAIRLSPLELCNTTIANQGVTRSD
jgi:hypothetical protein